MTISQNSEPRKPIKSNKSNKNNNKSSSRFHEMSEGVMHRVSEANKSVTNKLLPQKNKCENSGAPHRTGSDPVLSQEAFPIRTKMSEWDSINVYFRQALTSKLLSTEEEIAFAKKLHGKPLESKEEELIAARVKLEGHDDLREIFLCANLRLVVKIAHDFENNGLPLLDLIQEGNLGLLKAVDRFDPEKGARFSTYGSFWIKQSICQALHHNSRTIRSTVHHNEASAKLDAAEQEFLGKYGELPSLEQLSKITQIPLRSVEFVKSNILHTESLSAYRFGKDGEVQDLFDTIPDPNAEVPGAQMSFDEEIRLLPEVLKQLNMKEEYVIRYYFGLGGAKACTLKEIGEMFGHDCPESRELGMGRSVSRARIGQIKDATIVKARALIEHFGSTGAWPVMSDSPLKLCSEW